MGSVPPPACSGMPRRRTRRVAVRDHVHQVKRLTNSYTAHTVAGIAVEQGATALLMPGACRRQLFDLSDDMATKVDIQFYTDAREALLKAIQE